MGSASTRTSAAVADWTPLGRSAVFVLSATSIVCLLAEFYGLGSMRTWVCVVLLPAAAVLMGLALLDRFRGDGRLARAVLIGAAGGLLAAVAYDLFRLPFVLAAIERAGPAWLRIDLFRVFPRFGAIILGQPVTPDEAESQFTLAAHLVGWAYHLSNGVGFGVMYMAMVGNPARRTWLWAVAMAVGIEVGMLLTPYTGFFGIPLTVAFVVATVMAHTIFGVVLGVWCKRLAPGSALSAVGAR